MKRKDIEKAAEKYAEENSWYPGETSYESDIIAIEESFADAFKAGVKWRINSVWNDATEKPKLGELIIVEVYGRIWEYGKSDVCDISHPAARWAYMKDLIPNMED